MILLPGEPADTLLVSGTWSMTGDRAFLTASDGAGEWVVRFMGADVMLTLLDPAPTSVIQLRRANKDQVLRAVADVRSLVASAGAVVWLLGCI